MRATIVQYSELYHEHWHGLHEDLWCSSQHRKYTLSHISYIYAHIIYMHTCIKCVRICKSHIVSRRFNVNFRFSCCFSEAFAQRLGLWGMLVKTWCCCSSIIILMDIGIAITNSGHLESGARWSRRCSHSVENGGQHPRPNLHGNTLWWHDILGFLR